MKLTILNIENEIVTCKLDDGFELDISQKWFHPEIQINDVIDIDFSNRTE